MIRVRIGVITPQQHDQHDQTGDGLQFFIEFLVHDFLFLNLDLPTLPPASVPDDLKRIVSIVCMSRIRFVTLNTLPKMTENKMKK